MAIYPAPLFFLETETTIPLYRNFINSF